MTEELQAELNKNLAQIEDYTLTEEKILKGKETIAEKLKEAINENIVLTEEDKQIIDTELNNIKTSNSKDEIMLSISKIRNVLAKYLKGLKEVEKQPDKEEHDKQETNEQEEIQQQENNQEEVTQEQVNQEENNRNGEEEPEVNEDVEQELEQEESFDTGKIDSLSEDLQTAQDANYISKITAKRGRLIREIQREIAKIKKSDRTDAKTIEVLDKLETRLRTEIDNHKEQLNDRYRDEFKKQKATVPAILTVLPKGVALQVQKVDTCIREMIAAKTLKQKIAAGVNIAKSLGMVAATPIIFTAKFIARHWYLIFLLLSLLMAPNFKLKDKKNDDDELNKDPGLEREYDVDNVFDKQYGLDTSLAGEPALEQNLGQTPTLAPDLSSGLENMPSIDTSLYTSKFPGMEDNFAAKAGVKATEIVDVLNPAASQYNIPADELKNVATAQTVETPETAAMMEKLKADAGRYDLGVQQLQEFAKNNASTAQTVGTPETDAMMDKLKADAGQYDLGAQRLQEFAKNNASTAQTVGTPETDAMMEQLKVDANRYDLGTQRLQEFAKNNATAPQAVGTPETDAMMEKLKVDAGQYDLGAQQLQEFAKNNATAPQAVGTPETDAMMEQLKVDANRYDLGTQQLNEFVKNNASNGSVSAPSVEAAKNVDLPRASNLAPSLEKVKVPSIAELEKQGFGNGLDFDPTLPPEVAQIVGNHAEEFKHIMFEFANELEKNYNFFIGEWHKDVKVVHSAEEFTEAVEDLIGAKLNFADAKRVYLSGVDLPAADRSIIWPELEQETAGIIPVRYFETYGDMMNYVMSGADKSLATYYNNFAENYGKDLGIDFNIKMPGFSADDVSAALGISRDAAVILLFAFGVVKLGAKIAAIPGTGGLSLAIP